MPEKIKSSKVAALLNTCFNVSNLLFLSGAYIGSDGTEISGNANRYASPYFKVHNGATITVDGTKGEVSLLSTDYVAFYDKYFNFIESTKLKTIESHKFVCKVSVANENAGEIAYCRFSCWSKSASILVKATDWHRMGKGIVSLPISYGAKTTSETYINEDNASTTVDGYDVTSDVEQTALKGEPVFDYVDTIRKELATGSDCETDALVIPIYDLTKTATGYTGLGQQWGVTVTVTDFEIVGGEVAKIKYKISFNGNPKNVDVELVDGQLQPSLTLGTASTEDGEIIEEEEIPAETEE